MFPLPSWCRKEELEIQVCNQEDIDSETSFGQVKNICTSTYHTILSDHKTTSALILFNEHSATPTLATARIQRWALTLGAYNHHTEC